MNLCPSVDTYVCTLLRKSSVHHPKILYASVEINLSCLESAIGRADTWHTMNSLLRMRTFVDTQIDTRLPSATFNCDLCAGALSRANLHDIVNGSRTGRCVPLFAVGMKQREPRRGDFRISTCVLRDLCGDCTL